MKKMDTSLIIQTALNTQPKSASQHLDFLFDTVYQGMLESISRMIEKSPCNRKTKLVAQAIHLKILEAAQSDIKVYKSLSLDDKLTQFNLAHLMQFPESISQSEQTVAGLLETSRFLISLNEQSRIGLVSVNSNIKEYISLTEKCRQSFQAKFKSDIKDIMSLVTNTNTYGENKMSDEQFYKDAEEKLRASGNHKSPAKKSSELSKGIKKFLERSDNEENKKNH
jgi:hypothetical protein